jgi:hypothetical protein
MKAKIENAKRLDILGNGNHSSAQEVFNATLKQWWQKLGYCSIFAAVPAMLASQLPEARADEPTKATVNIPGRPASIRERLNKNRSNPTLLKRQSQFRLPHQKGNFAMLAGLDGVDDCPGAPILGGSYTAAAPYVASGDTTGANDTVTSIPSFYYYFNYSAHGPDHVYSFTLTSLGPNPRIEISTTSGTFKPMIYVLQGEPDGRCPAGTGNSGTYPWAMSDSRWTSGSSTAAVNIDYFRLNVPFHLFVDSASNDAAAAGPYTIKMQDVTIAPAQPCASANPIDCTDPFIRQQYLDFLGREPDPAGLAGWRNTLNNCPPSGKDANGNFCDRIEVSSAFFRSPEFQGRGYFIYRFYPTIGKVPINSEFMPDFAKVSGFLTDQQLEAAKAAFVNEFMARAEFQAKYSSTFNNPQAYVDALLQTVGLPNHPLRQTWINTLQGNNSAPTRAQVLRSLVESPEVYDKYYNEAFVVMQYFGYLRRTADVLYLNWIQTMNSNGGDYRTMINGFMNSIEYRQRFGP